MGLLNDVRISIRTLTKNGAFTIAAVLTVAIGVGATTAIATIVDSRLLLEHHSSPSQWKSDR